MGCGLQNKTIEKRDLMRLFFYKGLILTSIDGSNVVGLKLGLIVGVFEGERVGAVLGS